MFSKVLIANRGEIAVRVIRACRAAGIRTVAVYSDRDRAALHVQMADEAIRLGPAPAKDSYLSADKILGAAQATGAEAIHPGYGFLSENAGFAEACADAGVTFIGPPPSAIAAMGEKTQARALMREAGVPVVPGSYEPLRDPADAAEVAADIGFPVMLKAAAGGGGKGMRVVTKPEDLAPALERAQQEALASFGDAAVYVERAVLQPRHIEVQILADQHGSVIHLGERECSLQRRHQKVVEESPSPFVERHPDLRDRLTTAAIDATRACGYTNAGTIEFLVDSEANGYFLEMNTRLQVEHPVTELVTGRDLVLEQFRIAAGEHLSWRQADTQPRGHAIECRVYAEDWEGGFLPAPGKIERLREPSGPGVRVDSGVFDGWDVPADYDPLLAKLAVWGASRAEALLRLRAALAEYVIDGPPTTLRLFEELLAEGDFRAGDFDTGWLERWLSQRHVPAPQPAAEEVAAIAAVLEASRPSTPAVAPAASVSRWKQGGRAAHLR